MTQIGVLCVDDRPKIGAAVRTMLERAGGFDWKGWLPAADTLSDTAKARHPEVVLMDLDMPGKEPFIAIEELARECPEARVNVYSGQLSAVLVRGAVDAGAWGYVTKYESSDQLVAAIKSVAAGDCALSPRARSELPN